MVTNKNRNRVIQAALRQEQEDQFEDEAPISEEFDPMAAEELTTDDVLDELDEMTEAQRRAALSKRKRGQAPSGHVGHAAQAAQVEAETEDFEWRPTNSLDAPPPLPGMEQRWIRFMAGADNDPQNWSRAMRGRWVPRPLSTVPNTFAPPVQKTHLGEVIAVNDVILCHRDRRIGLSRRKYFRGLQKRQEAAAKRHFRNAERSDHPIKEYDPEIAPTVGRGRRAHVQEDEE